MALKSNTVKNRLSSSQIELYSDQAILYIESIELFKSCSLQKLKKLEELF